MALLKKVFGVTASLVMCAAFLLSSVCALAMNVDYLEIEKWKHNSNVTFSNLTRTASSSKGAVELNTNFGYYASGSEMTLYTYFDISEALITDKGKEPVELRNVSVVYNYHSQSENYTVAIDENGIREEDTPDEEEFELFGAQGRFYKNESVFISAAEYYGKEGLLTADVTLFVNGHGYNIIEGVTLERPTTTKPASTTKQKTTKSNKKKTDKSKNGKSSKGGKSKKDSTTKFTPKGQYTTAPSSAGSNSKSKSQNKFSAGGKKSGSATEKAQSPNKKNKKKKSKSSGLSAFSGQEINGEGGGTVKKSTASLIFLIIAVILATAGITLLIVAAVTREKKENKEDIVEKETDEE